MSHRTSLSPTENDEISAALREANRAFMQQYPGESDRRQAVHTVYGGAHLFKADAAAKLGQVALRSLEEHAPDAGALMGVLGIGESALGAKIYERVQGKVEARTGGRFPARFRGRLRQPG